MCSDKMFGICLYYTNNKQDAEDVLHDGFLKVFEHIAELKHDNLEAWMRRIFINTALMLYRRSKFQSDMENVEDSSSDYGIEDSGFDVHELMQLIQLLPQQYRLVFNLYAIEGYKHQEIAEMLQISVGTSKSNLSRALQILKVQLEGGDK